MKSQVAEVSKILAEETDLFYLGRGADYALVIEGALKVKEISYVHSEAMHVVNLNMEQLH